MFDMLLELARSGAPQHAIEVLLGSAALKTMEDGALKDLGKQAAAQGLEDVRKLGAKIWQRLGWTAAETTERLKAVDEPEVMEAMVVEV